MYENKDKSNIINFKKDVEKLKIPPNYNVMPVIEERYIEFMLEIK